MSALASRVIHVEEQQLVIGELDRLCVVVWRGAVTRERFERQRAALGDVARRHPDGMGFVCVIEPSAPPRVSMSGPTDIAAAIEQLRARLGTAP